MAGKPELPTDKERSAALASFEAGEFDPLEEYLRRALAWHLEASKDGFDRDVFIAARRMRGGIPGETEIRHAKRLCDDLRLPFKKDAAEDAFLLGRLLLLRSRRKEALVYLRQAVELAPDDSMYEAALAEAEMNTE
jgi:tetratricopeptide (TPR) repeat protein